MSNNNKEPFFSKEQVSSRLDILWKGHKKCEICNTQKWVIADELINLMPYKGGNLVIGGASYPKIMAICTTCGNTKLFNAMVLDALHKKVDKTHEK